VPNHHDKSFLAIIGLRRERKNEINPELILAAADELGAAHTVHPQFHRIQNRIRRWTACQNLTVARRLKLLPRRIGANKNRLIQGPARCHTFTQNILVLGILDPRPNKTAIRRFRNANQKTFFTRGPMDRFHHKPP
jgi:hypothetical protein